MLVGERTLGIRAVHVDAVGTARSGEESRFANAQMLHWASYLALVPLSMYVFLGKKIFGNKPVRREGEAAKR